MLANGGGAQSVWDTINGLRVERIGHGVHAIEDPKLVDYLADTGLVLELNPGSNIALGVYSRLAQHPIARLRDAGVKVTVSTDDPPIFPYRHDPRVRAVGAGVRLGRR